MREALGVPGCVREVYATEDALERHSDLAAACSTHQVALLVTDEAAMAALSGSVSPQGVAAVCGFVDVSLAEALALAKTPSDARGNASAGEARLVAVGAHLRDPGNAGTLIRCADAAGADAVVFAGSTVDPYNDKVVRASVGSVFHLPLVVGMTMREVVDSLHAQHFTVLAAHGEAELGLDSLAASGGLRGRVAWVFGNEAWGIPPEEQALCDRQVAVPLYGRAESLNVATAAAICLYVTAWAQRGSGIPSH